MNTTYSGWWSQVHTPVNLLLIPGGPGMGSEYFLSLVRGIKDNFSIWLVDLPGNGDNVLKKSIDYHQWSKLLPETADHIDGKLVYLGHSFGGMLLLSEPRLEQSAEGFILMSTVPKTIFFKDGSSYFDNNTVTQMIKQYQSNPSDMALKNMVVSLSTYYFEQNNMDNGKKMLLETHYAHLPYDALLNSFVKEYQAAYVPTIPTLILSGDDDKVTPIKYFANDQRFSKENIDMTKISNANHFPWINNPKETFNAINKFISELLLRQ